jgi:TRAP-type transport system small permease protein
MGRGLPAFARFMGKVHDRTVLICGFLFFLYMLNIVADVGGRYLFSMPIIGTIEIGENVLAVAVFMTLAAVEARKENIRVTLLEEHLSTRWKPFLDLLALCCAFAFVGLMAWQSYLFAARSFGIRETSDNIPIPLYIGKYAFFVGCILFCLQLVQEVIAILRDLFSHGAPEKVREEG